MNKEKQIVEMANAINEMDEPNAHYYDNTLQMHEAFADCFTIAKHLYEKGYRKQSEWIPVSEPPKENGIYCVMVENHKSRKYKKRTHARYKDGRWLDLYDNWENRCWHVTHWFPLLEAR